MISKKYLPLIYFILGFGIFMFTRLSKLVPSIELAIMVAPIFILRFSRTQPRKRAIWLTFLGFVLSLNIALWGLFSFDELWMTIVFGFIRSSLLATIWFLPFMFDRILYPKFSKNGILSTLIFPIATTAVFYLSSLEGPFDDGGGTLSSLGYGFKTLSFIQVRSVFGVWILIFIHTWLFSIVNYCLEHNFNWKKIKTLAIIYPSLILLIFVFGWIKTSSQFNSEAETVKIAAVVLLPEDGEAMPMSRIFESKTTSPFAKTLSRIEKLTEKAVSRGAQIVSFQEYAIVILQNDEEKLREQYKRIAKENNTYLSITYVYFSKNSKGENKHLFIDNNGEILLDYTKRYLLGLGDFGEAGVFKKGPEVIQSVQTPYGKIGISICKDMGYPKYVKQAALSGVDIMLSPSYDWPKSSSPWYITSTIENGFSLVRPTYNGYSYAADYNGKVLVHMDSDDSEDGIMYCDIPVQGIKVLYPAIGDLLGWMSLIIVAILIGITMFKKRVKNVNAQLF